MKLHRRKALVLAACVRAVGAETARPPAEWLADYSDPLRYEDLDVATIEQARIVVTS